MANAFLDETNNAINITGLVRPNAEPSKNLSHASLISPGLKPAENDFAPVAKTHAEAGLIKSTNDLVDATTEQTVFDKKESARKIQTDLLLAGANFALDMQNANSAYSSIEAGSQLKILEARRQAHDSLERGKQRSLEAQVEGISAGESALLGLAAQGQDVQGANAQKVQGSLEDIGLENGLQEEIDSIREALGFDLEEIAINYQVDQAEIQRDSSVISSGLNFATAAYSSTL